MTGLIAKELEDVNSLIIIGKYRDALEKLEKSIEVQELNISDEIRALILMSKCYARLGVFEVEDNYLERSCQISSLASKLSKKADSLQLIAETKAWYLSTYKLKEIFNPQLFLNEVKFLEQIYKEIKSKKISLPKAQEALILSVLCEQNRAKMLIIKNYIWDHQKTFGMLDEAIQLIQESNDKEILLCFLHNKAKYLCEINDYDKALALYEETLGIAEEIGNDYHKCLSVYELGGIHWVRGEYKYQLEYQKKALKICEKLGNERFTGYIFNRLGIYYVEIGDRKEGLEYFQKAYDILSEKGAREEYGYFLNNIGAMHSSLGNDEKALQCWETALKINKNLGRLEYANLNLRNLSTIYIRRGELDKGLKLLEEVLAYYEQINDKRGLTGTLASIGFVYRRKGIFKQACEYAKEYLRCVRELNIKPAIAGALYLLIKLALEFEKKELAEEYYEELVKITEEIEYEPYKDQALMAEAIILKKSELPRERVRAELIFDQLLKVDLHHLDRIEILFNLCELLLKELKETSDKKILTKLRKNLNQLIEIGSLNDNPYLSIEILWLKSQLSLLELNSKEARKILTETQQIAEEKGYNILALKVIKAKEQLLEQTIQLEELEVKSDIISKRMEIIKIENGFEEIRSSDRFQFKQQI
ncbi:MAG: tetratricopeptide repeat protein [Asgard group archaeon]|nr:tetratricopeptide repeat protein [Asgard group archaeon]